jgi:antirestriction protein
MSTSCAEEQRKQENHEMEQELSRSELVEELDSLERVDEAPPRIYVASLSDYNAGRLHGAWLDAGRSAVELQTDIDAMLTASPDLGAEEWAIHDYEGFGAARIDENESVKTVSALAQGIAEHGPAFAALAGHVRTDSLAAEPERFEQSFLGEWSSLEAFVEEMAADFGLEQELDKLPGSVRAYVNVDYASLARDVEADLIVIEHARGVWVFDPNA